MSTEEICDIYDSTGEKTGATKSRKAMIRDGDWRLVVHVWIINSRNEILVQQRSAEKSSFASLWDVSIGGGVEAGEESIVAAQREVEEELGVHIEPKQLKYAGRFKIPKHIPENGYTSNEFSDTYVVYSDVAIEDLTLQESEVADATYLPLKEFMKQTAVNAETHKWVPHGREYHESVMKIVKELIK